MITETLITAVIEQIKIDLLNEDLTAIEELLAFTPEENLRAFLSEEQSA